MTSLADQSHAHVYAVPGKVNMGLFRHNRPVFDALFPNQPADYLDALRALSTGGIATGNGEK